MGRYGAVKRGESLLVVVSMVSIEIFHGQQKIDQALLIEPQPRDQALLLHQEEGQT